MEPPEQDQHKVPKVYLKKFGYLDKNNHWKISVMKMGEHFTRQKGIKGFTATTNHFDIDSNDPAIQRVFESLNSALDDKYNAVVNDLVNNGKLSDETDAYLVQFIANLISRSDFWREWAMGVLAHENRPHVIKTMLWFYLKDKITFEDFENEPLFQLLAYGKPDEVINRVLMIFTGHLLLRLQHYEIVILKAPIKQPWFTSTNPVVVHNRVEKFELVAKESEFYFPLSPEYLAYLHCNLSEDKENEFRQYASNVIHSITNEQSERVTRLIIDNAYNEYLIFAGHFEHRYEKPAMTPQTTLRGGDIVDS